VIARNHLLTAMMRRPWPVVVRRGSAAWRDGGPRRSGVVAAVPRLPAALARRRKVPAWVEKRALALDADTVSHDSRTLR
jgi:hypothetical protein